MAQLKPDYKHIITTRIGKVHYGPDLQYQLIQEQLARDYTAIK